MILAFEPPQISMQIFRWSTEWLMRCMRSSGIKNMAEASLNLRVCR